MKTPKEILFPDVDEIENNDWDSLREFLEDTLKAIQDDLHRNVYEDLKILVEPWIDYSAISTIVGWASFTTKLIYYKKIGKIVFVTYKLAGESNSISTSFTLPFPAKAGSEYISFSVQTIKDNGTLEDNGDSYIDGSLCVIRRRLANPDWTASGEKQCAGAFWYEIE